MGTYTRKAGLAPTYRGVVEGMFNDGSFGEGVEKRKEHIMGMFRSWGLRFGDARNLYNELVTLARGDNRNAI